LPKYRVEGVREDISQKRMNRGKKFTEGVAPSTKMDTARRRKARQLPKKGDSHSNTPSGHQEFCDCNSGGSSYH